MGKGELFADNEKQMKADFMISEIEELIGDEDFQLEFFESLRDQFNRKGYLSMKQLNSLTKMHQRITEVNYNGK